MPKAFARLLLLLWEVTWSAQGQDRVPNVRHILVAASSPACAAR